MDAPPRVVVPILGSTGINSSSSLQTLNVVNENAAAVLNSRNDNNDNGFSGLGCAFSRRTLGVNNIVKGMGSPGGGSDDSRVDKSHWLDTVAGDVKNSVEWQALCQQLYSRVQKELQANKVFYLSDLTEDEKILMMDQVEESLSDGTVFRNFSKVLNEKIEDGITSLLCDSRTVSRSEQVVKLAACGVSSMFGGMPTTLPAVRLLLNQPIPLVLRVQIWGMVLQNSKALEAYCSRTGARNRVSTIAQSDSDVVERCQEIFDTDFPDLQDSSTMVMIAKTALSYRVTLLGDIKPCDYYLIIPLVVVFAKVYSDLPRVVEAIAALSDMPRPRCSSSATAEAQSQLMEVAETFCGILEGADPELFAHLSALALKEKQRDEKQRGLLAERVGPKQHLLSLVQHVIDNAFVGTLSLEACLYVWDQCLLVGFDRLTIPYTVCVVLLLREQLFNCNTTFAAAQQVVRHQGKAITVQQLLHEVEARFMDMHVRKPLGIPLRNTSHFKDNPVQHLAPSVHAQVKEALLEKEEHAALATAAGSPRETSTVSDATVKAQLEQKLGELYPTLSEDKTREQRPVDANNATMITDDKTTLETDASELNGVAPISAETREQDENESGAGGKQSDETTENQADQGLVFPLVDERYNHLVDTLKRAQVLNPNADTAELQAELVKRNPDFANHNASAKVFEANAGGQLCFFRTLLPEEGSEVATAIVSFELKRIGAGEENLAKLAKQLVEYSGRSPSHDSATYKGQQQPAPPGSDNADIASDAALPDAIKCVVLDTISAISLLRNK